MTPSADSVRKRDQLAGAHRRSQITLFGMLRFNGQNGQTLLRGVRERSDNACTITRWVPRRVSQTTVVI